MSLCALEMPVHTFVCVCAGRGTGACGPDCPHNAGRMKASLPALRRLHTCTCTQVCKPKEFAGQINLNMDHCWGIIRALVDMLLKLDDGKYLCVKDPMKELMR